MTDSIVSLGTCKCPRCCCCPPTVYYPPTLSVNWVDIGSSTSFTISCTWLDCPVGTESNPGLAFPTCTPGEGEGPACYGIDPDTGEIDPDQPADCVSRCHACEYNLLGADGTPGIKPTLVEVADPDLGSAYIHLPPDTPYISYMDGESECRKYITSFGIYCGKFHCNEGSDICSGPGIYTYIDPNTGDAYGWQGFAGGHVICDGGINGWDDPTYFNCPITNCPEGASFCTCVDLSVWSEDFNLGITEPDDPEDGLPPLRIFNPLDPWKFSCCPLNIRFLLGQFEPFTYAGGDGCHNGYWPDPSEWPLTMPGQYVPWNFAILPLCCCFDYFGDATDHPGACAPNFDCQANPLDGQPFGYIDITGGASCFLPADHDTNCLNALLPDDDPNKC